MGLNEKIHSYQTQVAAIRVQPYQATTDLSAYANRDFSPAMVAPGISDSAFSTAPVLSIRRGTNPVPARGRSAQIWNNGTAATYGSTAPTRG